MSSAFFGKVVGCLAMALKLVTGNAADNVIEMGIASQMVMTVDVSKQDQVE